MNNGILQRIKDQEMDRKDFLKYSGAVLLSAFGLKAAVTLLNPQPGQTPVVANAQQSSTSKFGSGKYGV